MLLSVMICKIYLSILSYLSVCNWFKRGQLVSSQNIVYAGYMKHDFVISLGKDDVMEVCEPHSSLDVYFNLLFMQTAVL